METSGLHLNQLLGRCRRGIWSYSSTKYWKVQSALLACEKCKCNIERNVSPFRTKHAFDFLENCHIQHQVSCDHLVAVHCFPSLIGFSQHYLPRHHFIAAKPGFPGNLSHCLKTTFCLSLTGLHYPYVLQPPLLTTVLIPFLNTSYRSNTLGQE